MVNATLYCEMAYEMAYAVRIFCKECNSLAHTSLVQNNSKEHNRNGRVQTIQWFNCDGLVSIVMVLLQMCSKLN